MSILKCKMCGGDLNVIADEKTVECEFCGTTQTIPDGNDEKKTNLFNRANRLRMENEFDKAAGVYESIVAEFPEEAEGYWGIVLCSYGIEYVDDAKTGKKIPTCHRTLTSSVMEDENFVQACENADVIARGVYREEAKIIDKLQQQIVAVVENEEPYDVFICYKETDDITKGRTEDSQIAQDIYTELIKEGYKVFFSRVTLRDKAGTEYEPYIYAALKSAKVMLAIGTKYDYYDAVWVKNEWSRYISMMADDNSKHLIPCFKNLDAYDIPKEFRNLQALDMGEVTFFKNLTNNVERLVPRKEAVQTKVIETTTTSNNATVTSLLQRVFMFLVDGNWYSADKYCEKVLDINPECAEAYLGKLMAELRVKIRDDLKKCDESFEKNNNYQKAVRFADDELKAELHKIRNENLYNKAVSLLDVGKFSDAIPVLKQIENYKDSKALLETTINGENEKLYNKAVSLLEVGETSAAIHMLKQIENYKNSKALLETTLEKLYNKAVSLLDSGKFFAAIPVLKLIEDYKDSNALLELAIKGKGETIELARVGLGSILNKKYGYINEKGDMVIEPRFDYAYDFSENGLAGVELNDKYGYINEKGDMVIEPRFDDTYGFSENGLAKVKLKGKYGYINEKGDMVIEPRFDYASSFGENGLAAVELKGKYGYINEKGDMVIEPRFDVACDFFKNGLAVVKLNGKYGYINEKGDMVIEPRFDGGALSFSENGLARVVLNDKYGYINEKGDMVIEPRFDDTYGFSENGLAAVELNGKWGYINEKGDMVIEPCFDSASSFGENGLAAVELNEKYGYINNDKYGYINKKGDMVIEPRFDVARDFSENGLAPVMLNGKLGYINEKGDMVIEPRFYSADPFINLPKANIDKRNERIKIMKQNAKEMLNHRKAGLCQHCGGEFKGVFTKTCTNCGKKKDY